MGMRENWELFVRKTKSKGKSHNRAAQHWDGIGTVLSLSLIFLGALTTFMALIQSIPVIIVAGIAAVSTCLSAVTAFLRPADRRQMQSSASREFQELMMRMVRCEEEAEYEELWRDFNKAIVDAPFLPKKFVEEINVEWTMTPELQALIEQKEGPEEENSQRESEKYNNDQSKQQPIGVDNFGYGTINPGDGPYVQHNMHQSSNDENLELLVHK